MEKRSRNTLIIIIIIIIIISVIIHIFKCDVHNKNCTYNIHGW